MVKVNNNTRIKRCQCKCDDNVTISTTEWTSNPPKIKFSFKDDKKLESKKKAS
jgi:hypothetical protein